MAGASWLQLLLSVVSFFIVTSRLGPTQVGIFGIAALLVGVGQTLIGGLFTDSLQQRQNLTAAQTNATFWLSLGMSLALTGALVFWRNELASQMGAPEAGDVLAALAMGIALGAAASIPGALLVRDLRYGQVARINATGAVVSIVISVVAVLLGAGVWSLVAADLAGKALKLVLLFNATQYKLGPPRNLGAIGDLMGFNFGSLGAYVLGYADRIAPRALTGALLGPQAVGYLILAERVLELLSQLVLAPLSSVAMAAVARLQDDRVALQNLVVSLYQLATSLGYPAFFGAVVVTPLLPDLIGGHWAPAVLTTQILLLVGLRTSTGAFNIAILRGLGSSAAPLLLLGLGLLLQVFLLPMGAEHGTPGVATAVLIRTFATWPLGCWLIYRATGLSLRQQTLAGAPALVAAGVMAGVCGCVLVATRSAPALASLVLCVCAGAVVYPAILLLASVKLRGLAAQLLQSLRSDGPRSSLRTLRSAFGLGD